MEVFYEEIIAPSLKGLKHKKILSIFGDDFAFDSSNYSYTYLTKLMEVFSNYSAVTWN